jgi:hypothetical protein
MIIPHLSPFSFGRSIHFDNAKLSFKIDRAIKIFHDKQKLKEYDHKATITEDSIRDSSQEYESKQNHERTGSLKPQKKKQHVFRE